MPTLADLYSIPDVDSKWYEIGLSLLVDSSTLQNIRKQQKNDFRRKREMFKKFLESDRNRTWRRILKALVDTGEWRVLLSSLSFKICNYPLLLLSFIRSEKL